VIEANDPVWEDLCRVAQGAQQSPQTWLEQRHFYGGIADNTAFCDAFARWLTRLHSDGCVATLQTYLEAA
jgi:mannitol 2-dehydrogenase